MKLKLSVGKMNHLVYDLGIFGLSLYFDSFFTNLYMGFLFEFVTRLSFVILCHIYDDLVHYVIHY